MRIAWLALVLAAMMAVTLAGAPPVVPLATSEAGHGDPNPFNPPPSLEWWETRSESSTSASSTSEARGTAAAAATGEPPLRVYVVVVDGLRPQEVGPLMPTLAAIRDDGTWYEQARAIFPAETLPNHAAMATGVLPTKNGIVANQFFRPGGGAQKEYMQLPEFLDRDTIVSRLERAYEKRGGISTATILSKEYLFGLFRGENSGDGDPHPQLKADFHWDPRTAFPLYIPDPSAHAVDKATMEAFMGWITQQDDQEVALPQFAFVNLGDVDRAGHADPSGSAFAGSEDDESPLTAGDISAFRQGAIEDTDLQLGLLVDQLKQIDGWEETVLIVLSDHGMDWGRPDQVAKTAESLSAAGYEQGTDPGVADFWPVGGGGSELIYVHHEPDIAPMARVLSTAEGVEFVATREPVPGLDNPTLAEVGVDHPRSPDIEVFLKPGYRSSPPGGTANPLPGNHGHAITQHSVLLVGGGHPILREEGASIHGEQVYDRSRQKLFVPPAGGPGVLSVAPTAAALFGIGDPPGGYDVPPLAEAFDPEALPGGGGSGPPGESTAAPTGGDPIAGRLTTTLAAKPASIIYGKRFSLSGRVTGNCPGPSRITLYRQPAGSDLPPRVLVNSVRSGADGEWSYRVKSQTSAMYSSIVQPTPSCSGSASDVVPVPVRARVDILARRCGLVSGRVLPRAPRTKVVLEQLRRGKYRRVASQRLDRASRFSVGAHSCAGRYRVRWPKQGERNAGGSTKFALGGSRR